MAKVALPRICAIASTGAHENSISSAMASGAADVDDPPTRVDRAESSAAAEAGCDRDEPTAEEIAERVDTYAEVNRLARGRKKAILAIALSPDEPHAVCDWRCECCGSALIRALDDHD